MERSSRLLRVLVAGLLAAGVSGKAQAVTDLDAIRVWGFTQGGWMINGWGGGGGGGYWGGTSTSQPTAEEQCMFFGMGCEDFAPTCPSLLASAPQGCNLAEPPAPTTNGCGAGPTAGIVPDYLIVNGIPAVQFGSMFTEPCNAHDECYGRFRSGKRHCDEQLELDMIESARQHIPWFQWMAFEPFVLAQASAYRRALESPPIALIARQAYDAAQVEGKCRAVADAAEAFKCEV